jgi:hypothetical protein
MSDEQRRDEEPEVEAHSRMHLNDEPAEDETEDEVEAHMPRQGSPRQGLPRQG